jgi:hypothetical protein
MKVLTVKAAGMAGEGAEVTEVVAVDAAAARLVHRMGSPTIHLAPGGLRWLADRWDAQRDREARAAGNAKRTGRGL